MLLMLTNNGWVDGSGSNPGGGFGKPGGGRETRGGEDGLEGPDGQLSINSRKDGASLSSDDEEEEEMNEEEICLRVDLEPDEWIKDSGCSKHMTGNRKLFSTYKAYNRGNVIFGSNLRGNIIGKGTISNDSLKIDNVEHVDNLGFNLLSIGQICDNKCRVTFSEHDSEITKDGRVIGRGIRKKGLYVMKLGNTPNDQICLATIDENSTLWHRRLGHANMRLIPSLASKELVRNLPKLKFDQYFCDACKIGKQAHASHKAKNIVSTTRCLELFQMDLFGPSAVRSYGGNRYTLVIVDDYSRYTWTRFLKDKTEAFDQFEILSRKIQNQLGYSQNSKAYIILNKHTRKVEESINMTFNETPPPSKTSPLVDDDLDEEEAIKYIKEMLKKFGLEDSKPMKTPMSSDTKLTKDEECLPISCLCLPLCPAAIEPKSLSTLKALRMLFDILVLEETNRSCYIHYRSRIRKHWKGMSTSTMDEQALIDYEVRLDNVPIMCDNKGAIDLSKNPVQHSRTKHIKIRHHFLRGNVQKGHISIEKVPSVDNIADILTKPLKRESFNYLRLGLDMMEHIP
ncbi:retrovirus-related pol polyprotein from transposon TNT 1-94 [Tanacetum coccineum]|uniref:Retrovirus-related pol polyprotein from transposon TNT 1-94 n=1 Tax=Tanacetum coccineum TaxID=301880 RepID=A0ABQ5HHC4_9ASTR